MLVGGQVGVDVSRKERERKRKEKVEKEEVRSVIGRLENRGGVNARQSNFDWRPLVSITPTVSRRAQCRTVTTCAASLRQDG